jgi:bromodomain-containing factor 1
MCLNDVKEKLDSGKYEDSKSFFSDINQIWKNCKKYNMSKSLIYSTANKLEKQTKEIMKSYYEQLKKKENKNFLGTKRKQDEIDESFEKKPKIEEKLIESKKIEDEEW